jgi:trehalose-phosphatase
LLEKLAATRGLGLLLDYDGTMAEIVADPSNAKPLPEIPALIDRLAASTDRVKVAVVTGRRIAEVRELLGLKQPTLFSGLHGMEVSESDGTTTFSEAALASSSELEQVRSWLGEHVPAGRGFWIEDKQVAIGLHYRQADPEEARAVCRQFSDFAARNTQSLKLLPLKMLLEAVPKAAGKGLAVAGFRRRFPRSFVVAYFGDDTTDEDAFAALAGDDIGVLVGPPRASRASYRVSSPHAVADELRRLAAMSPAQSATGIE